MLGRAKVFSGSEVFQTGMGRRQQVSNLKVSPSCLSVLGAAAAAQEKDSKGGRNLASHL